MATKAIVRSKKSTLYHMTPAHARRLKEWQARVVANSRRTDPMTEADQVATEVAIRGIYRSIGRDGDKVHVLFCASPDVARIAARLGFAAGWLNERLDWQRKILGRSLVPGEMRAALERATTMLVRGTQSRMADLTPSSLPFSIPVNAAHDAANTAHAAAHAAAHDAHAAANAAVNAAHAAAHDAHAANAAAHDAHADAHDAAHAAHAAANTAHAAVNTAANAAANTANDAVNDAVNDANDAADAAVNTAAHDADIIAYYLIKSCRYYWWRYPQNGNLCTWHLVGCGFFMHVAKIQINWQHYRHHEDAAMHSGPRIMFDRFCIVSDRCSVLEYDDRNRLHCATGPAIGWSNGSCMYHWHGVRVPRRLIVDPKSYSADEYKRLPAEQRRALGEHLGWPKILQMLGSTSIDATKIDGLSYELLRCGDGSQYLRMQSPVLQDGSQPYYLEPVHEALTTAAGARKWRVARNPDGRWWGPEECDKNRSLSLGQHT
jgi:hypothetical protein